MMKLEFEINKCDCCDNKATMLYYENMFFGTTLKFLCKECNAKRKLLR